MKTDLLVAWPWLFFWACESVSKLSWLRLHPSAVISQSSLMHVFVHIHTAHSDDFLLLVSSLIWPYLCWKGTLNSNQPTNSVGCVTRVFFIWTDVLLSFSRHHLRYDDCLEDKRDNYENCSVLYCVQQLYTMIHTHMHIAQTHLGSCWF